MPHTQLSYGDYTPQGTVFPMVIVLDHVRDPKNVGSVFRLADALGISCLYLCGDTPCPPHKEIKRVSRSCERTVAWLRFNMLEEAALHARKHGFRLVALELTNRSRDIGRVDMKALFPLALVARSERNGVSQYILDTADEAVHIPMHGQNSSMNVSMALAIASHEALRQYTA